MGGADRVGWSLAWLGGAAARLRQAERAYLMLNKFVSYGVGNNLWDIIDIPSMGGDIFQIDGNLGYVAAMSEMLIQSHEDTVALIPAIPARWDHGSFHGLRARGGYELDVCWEQHEVTSFDLRAMYAGTCKIELPASQKALTFTDADGNVYFLPLTTTGGSSSSGSGSTIPEPGN